MAVQRKVVRRALPQRSKIYSRVFTGGMPRTLGMRLVLLTRQRVVSEMRIAGRHRNPDNRVNGGAIMSFADATAAAGAVAAMAPGFYTATLESKTNFLGAGVGPVLKAEAVPLHMGRTTSVWQTTISDSDGRRIAVVTQTQIYLPETPVAGKKRSG